MANFSNGRFSLVVALAVLFFICASMAGAVFAQTGVITGSVVESGTDRTLPGANVLIVGTNLGAASDVDGNYQIVRVPPGTYQLEVRFMGYKTQTKEVQVIANQEVTIDFEMGMDPFKMDAVVVTGVASKTSKAVAEIAVQRLSAAELVEKSDYEGVSDMLGAKIAGVSMTKASGAFGADVRMTMRSGGGINGDGQPVFYVDGVKLDGSSWRGSGNVGLSPIAHINPEDIESIEVIKGPAGAGSYGTGGANGVVVITTKRGRIGAGGEGAKNWAINYKGTFGYHDQVEQYDINQFRNYQEMNDYFTKGDIKKHALSLTGGSNELRLYLGMDRSAELGHTPRSGMDQLSLRANVDYLPSPKFNVSVSSAYNNIQIDLPQAGRGDGEFGHITFNVWPWEKDRGWWASKDAFLRASENQYLNSYVGSFQAEFVPFAGADHALKGLSARVTFGVDDKDNRNIALQQPLVYDLHGDDNPGFKAIAQRHSRVYTINSDARFDYDLFGIKASATAGLQLFEERSRSTDMAKEEFSTDLITDIGAGSIYDDIGEGNNHFKSAGIFTEHNFSYKNTYFGSFMVRKDYASVMGAEAASIIYPRGSGAVRLDRMGFLPPIFSLFKLRTAYGETGILPGRTDGIEMLWSADVSQYGVGAELTDLGNPAIKPERIKEWEIGFETEIANFAVDFTYYKQWAEDSIIPQSPIMSSGVPGTPMRNIGKIEGSGWEGQLQAFFAGEQLGGWSANFSLLYSYQQNEVIDMNDEIVSGGPGGGRQVYMEGLPKGAFYNPICTGALFAPANPTDEHEIDLWPSPREGIALPGEFYNVQTSGGPIFLGTGIPDYVGSFSTTLSAFGFSLYGMFQWKTGFEVYNEGRVDMHWYGLDVGGWYHSQEGSEWVDWNEGAGGQVYRFDWLSQALGMGDCNVDPNEVPLEGFEIGSQEYIDAANEWAQKIFYYDANSMQPGDFIKLRELSLSYDCGKLIEKAGLGNTIRGLSIGVVGRNLWQKFHKEFTGMDSEINSMGYGSGPQNMMQSGTIPPSKSISMFFQIGL